VVSIATGSSPVFQHDGHALARADAYPDRAEADVAFAQFARVKT
jgi:hypothetical protein